MPEHFPPTGQGRTLRPGQRAQLLIVDADGTAPPRILHEQTGEALEAPNWTPDGAELVYNAGGLLHRIAVDGTAAPRRIDTGVIDDANNDHVLSPDGKTVYLSSNDGHLYAVPLDGSAAPHRVTGHPGEPPIHHYLHGISPDGATLAYTGVDLAPDGSRRARILTVPTAGGPRTVLTDGPVDDGADYAPDGAWIYFNSETDDDGTHGHAQLHRIRPDGTGREQLTRDERVNWFPHPSPDGTRLLQLSFPPGTEGHPADLDVLLRMIDLRPGADRTPRDVLGLFGGQGTVNVGSWAPDGRQFACVAYPLD